MKYCCCLLSVLFFTFKGYAQHQDKVDFTHAEVLVSPDGKNKEIRGKVFYDFKVLANVDSVFLDAKNIDFNSVRLNGRKTKFSNDGRHITIKRKFKEGKSYKLFLDYVTRPKQAVYFFGFDDKIEGNEQVWTQGQGKYTSHWLPSFDAMEEKVEFDLNFDHTKFKGLTIIANGAKKEVKSGHNQSTIVSFDMLKPMSSYLLAFAIGDYKKQELTSLSGIPIENYYDPQDSLKIEPTYRYTKEIFDFLEEEIGFPYPWQNYKQVPVHDFLYAGMENTGCTIFSDGYVIDSIAFIDKNYVNVNAHEMAHQWFGNLVTEKDANHHWLHEGFATYYALLAEKQLFGDANFYLKLYDSAKQLHQMSTDGKGESLTDPTASSLTFYEKGAWALYMLRNTIKDRAFKAGIKNYLESHTFKNVTISDFITEMEKVSGKDLSQYKKTWLESEVFPYKEAKTTLKQSAKPIADFIDLQWDLTTSLDDNETVIQGYWQTATSNELKARVISKYHKSLSVEFIKKVFESDNLKIRQALATLDGDYPVRFKNAYESLLNDESYITIENALYRLWVNFPKDRVRYLNKTKDIIGLPNKNVRQLWLLLAVLTSDFENGASRKESLTELRGYTSPEYSFEVRQLAFQLIQEVFTFSNQNFKDLLNATAHHTWQFRKYARNLLDKLLTDDVVKAKIINLSQEVKVEDSAYLNQKLNKE